MGRYVVLVLAIVFGLTCWHGDKVPGTALPPTMLQDAKVCSAVSPFQNFATAYKLNYESHGQSRDGVSTETLLVGAVRLTPVNERLWQGDFSVERLTLRLGKNFVPAQAEQAVLSLSKGVLIKVNDDFLVTDFQREGASPFERNLIREIASALQSARRPGSCPARWQATEWDANGAFSVEYAEVAKGHIQKIPGDTRSSDGLHGHRTGRTDLWFEDRLPETIEAHLTLEIQSDNVFLATVTSAVHLTRAVPFEVTPQTIINGGAQVPMNGLEEGASAKAGALARIASETPLASLLGSASHLEKLSGGATAQLVNRLYAHVTTHDTAVTALTETARALPARSREFGFLVGILGLAGTAAAQGALIDLAAERASEPAAVKRILVAVSQTKEPSPSVELLVQEWTRPDSPIRSTAVLVLGALAANLRLSAPDRAASLDALLPINEPLGLAALGNAASPLLHEHLQTIQDVPTAQSRSELLFAARRLDRQRTEGMILGLLQSDPDPDVRKTAAVVLGWGTASPATLKAATEALRTEKSEVVRLELVRNLWKSRSTFPAALETISALADADPSAEVRKAARALLATISH